MKVRGGMLRTLGVLDWNKGDGEDGKWDGEGEGRR